MLSGFMDHGCYRTSAGKLYAKPCAGERRLNDRPRPDLSLPATSSGSRVGARRLYLARDGSLARVVVEPPAGLPPVVARLDQPESRGGGRDPPLPVGPGHPAA